MVRVTIESVMSDYLPAENLTWRWGFIITEPDTLARR
jgi:hypothetical protein